MWMHAHHVDTGTLAALVKCRWDVLEEEEVCSIEIEMMHSLLECKPMPGRVSGAVSSWSFASNDVKQQQQHCCA